MARKKSPKSIIFLLVLAMILPIHYATSYTHYPHLDRLNAQCVSCHAATISAGMKQANLHMPFFEQRCVECHIDGEVANLEEDFDSQPEQITGSVVSQEPIWTKRKAVNSSPDKTTDHAVSLEGIDPEKAFRFRLVLRQQNGPDEGETKRGPWLGLALAEFPDTGYVDLSADLPAVGGTIAPLVPALSLRRFGRTGLMVNWQTSGPFFGSLEVEELSGLNLGGKIVKREFQLEPPRENEAKHPKLRDPEDLTITVCLSCHSEGELGTSHPVRIYARNGKTLIPSDLPTINGGMLTCVTCHHPHGAPGKHLVREMILTKLCVACHYTFQGQSRATMF
jgi:predicted CXXCH cytochrome family protein